MDTYSSWGTIETPQVLLTTHFYLFTNSTIHKFFPNKGLVYHVHFHLWRSTLIFFMELFSVYDILNFASYSFIFSKVNHKHVVNEMMETHYFI